MKIILNIRSKNRSEIKLRILLKWCKGAYELSVSFAVVAFMAGKITEAG